MPSEPGPEHAFAGRRQWTMVSMQDGRAEASWTPQPDVANPVGNVHGGVVATIIDEMTGAAVISAIEAPSAPTISMHIDFLHAVAIGGTYTAIGEVVRLGRAVAVADARILDEDGRMLARGTCIFQVPRSK
jgi:uncharacterized protein (TIGR00369 family)